MRRFAFLPASVAFDATGFDSPNPGCDPGGRHTLVDRYSLWSTPVNRIRRCFPPQSERSLYGLHFYFRFRVFFHHRGHSGDLHAGGRFNEAGIGFKKRVAPYRYADTVFALVDFRAVETRQA